jgi:hypothetical protein
MSLGLTATQRIGLVDENHGWDDTDLERLSSSPTVGTNRRNLSFARRI